MTELKANLLWELQQAIPLEPEPFHVIGMRLWEFPRQKCWNLIRKLMDEGKVRRVGAVFDARRLGYRSALCAVDVPPAELERVAERPSARTVA